MLSLRNLQTLLLVVVLLALLPMLALGIHSGLRYREQALATAQNSVLALIRQVEAEQRQAVKAAGMLLQTLGEVPQVVQQDSAAASELFQSLLAHFPQFANIAAHTPNGRIFASAIPEFMDRRGCPDDSVQRAVTARELVLGNYYVCPVTGKMVFSFALPVMNSEGEVHCVLRLDFDLAYAGGAIQMAGLPQSSTFVMSDPAGTILYRYPAPESWRGKPIQSHLHEHMLATGAQEGVFRGMGLDNVPRLYGFKLFTLGPGSEGIHLRVGIPEVHVLGQVDSLLQFHMIGALFVAGGVLLLARIGCAGLLFRPVSRIIEASQSIAQGTLQVRSGLAHTQDDMGLLATAFDSMAAALEKREQEREAAARSIIESRERIGGMLNASSDAVILVDLVGAILDLNLFAAKRRGKLPEALLGTCLFESLPEESACIRAQRMQEAAQTGDTVSYEEERGEHWYGIRIHPIRDSQGNVSQLVSYSRDITERKRIEERLTRQAFEDALTSLPNRALFIRELQQAIAKARDNPFSHYAVLFLDIDDFKLVNDSFGHHAGDRLLFKLGQRLREVAGPGRVVARFGGDEFAVLLPEILDSIDVLRLTEAIHRTMQLPERVEELELYSSASIGVVYGRQDYSEPDQILRDADIAMYQAKAKGRGNTECFTLDMGDKVNERLSLEHELRSALDNGELLLHYQPYYTLLDLRLAGFEALVRWQHPKRGLVSPALFIPIAEETGLIHRLGEFVLNEALRVLRLWNQHRKEQGPLCMNVNFSPRQMFHGDPVALVRKALVGSGVAPDQLVLEITETSLAEDMEHAADILETLRHFGVKTALDDFGTGYSSLAYLQRLPLDVLKLDRSFVQHLGTSQRDTAIASRLVALAETLGLKVTAEGVENVDVLQQLCAMRCTTAQGYHLSPPVPQSQVTGILEKDAQAQQR